MANYNIVSDISDALVKLLREGMVPEIIPNSEGIGVCHPSDKGDLSLGIYLYDIKRNIDIIDNDMVPVGTSKQRSPSSYLDLYYMITAYSTSDIKFRSIEEAKILGRAIQLLEGTSLLKGEVFGNSFSELKYPPKIEMLDLESEEKRRIWNMTDTPYKLSLFYKVYPVEIESVKIKSITRVVEADFSIEEKPIG